MMGECAAMMNWQFFRLANSSSDTGNDNWRCGESASGSSAMQAELDAAGIKLKIDVKAA